MKSIEVSIIITAHTEGLLAHKTMLSVLRSAELLEKQRIPYEIIIHIDNGDAATIDYYNRYQKDTRFRIFTNSFGEPASSRNFAAKQAVGKYLMLVDGDDLISRNWLLDGYNILKKSTTPLILHPEVDLTFGVDSEIRMWRMRNSYDLDKDTLILFGRNRWCAGTYLSRETALKYPYIPASHGYGYEDWHFNQETRGAGVIHDVIPGSVLFHRIKKHSTYLSHMAEKTVTAYSSLFETSRMQALAKTIPEEPVSHPGQGLDKRTIMRYGYKAMKHIPGVRRLASKAAEKVWDASYQQKISSIPQFLLDEWRAMNKIENCLYPTHDIIARMPFYDSDTDYLGKIYCKLISKIRKNPDYLFIPPLLNVGGTEKVIVNYLHAFAKIHPDWHIVVLSVLGKNHNYDIPDNVDFVDFDGIVAGLPDYDKDFLLSRFIIQTKVKRLHIINNAFAYIWAEDHQRLLIDNDYIVNVSHFMHEYTGSADHVYSFADPFLRNIYPSLNKVFTDNQSVIGETLSNNAFDPKKFSVHYQPVSLDMHPPIIHEHSAPVRILWASRVSAQKSPETLKEIAKSLPSDKYQIDVYGRFQPPYDQHFFDDVDNINYKGYYNDISSLPASDYDVFLYTSHTDGLPNILLEISSLGLPIVASNVGGVGDFVIDHQTGRTIQKDDIPAYKKAIDDIVSHPRVTKRYIESAQELINSRHSQKKFLAQVKKDIT